MTHGPWAHESIAGLPARLLHPHPEARRGARAPLVVFLHGSGERGSDNEAQLQHGIHTMNAPLVRREYPCLTVAPQCPQGSSWGGTWFGGPNATQAALVELVTQLARRDDVDAARVYLVGASMGAIGGWELLALHLGLFAAAVLLCGEPDLAWAPRVRGQPIWSFHGAEDRQVPPALARALHQRLPPPARYTELPGRGHDLWKDVFENAEMYRWLFSHRR